MRTATLLLCLLLGWQLSAQDQVSTTTGPITIHPIVHGSLVLEWQGMQIFIDPYGGAALYENFQPDLILVTDIHGDHYNPETLNDLNLDKSQLVAPMAVVDLMEASLKNKTTTLANGANITMNGIKITALPMYNLPENSDSRHPKGRGNGYVLEMGGKRIYISGDTEDIPEMRALKNIDVAFICMNLPYTMDVDQASSAVIEFKPQIVYPFHYRGGGGKFADVEQFQSLVEASGNDIEVRLRKWYEN